MATLAEIRAKLAESQSKNSEGPKVRPNGDGASYPFWNLSDNGGTSTIRFLPDGNPDNTYFWVQREVIRLPFAGVTGSDFDTTDEVFVQVPCIDMFEPRTCPIVKATRPLWKTDENLARAYWKKKSYIFQGFVVADGLNEEDKPENPIRRFVINPSIFKIIEASLMDPEMEDLPTDYDGGVDFRIVKSRRGDYADYSTSNWSRKPRALSEDERAAIAQHGLFDLRQTLGEKPDANGVAMLEAMVKASLAGEPYDYASYGSTYRFTGGGKAAQEQQAAANVDTRPQAAAIMDRINQRTGKAA